MTTEQLADKFIKELQDKGYTPEQMTSVFRKSNIIFNQKYRKVYVETPNYIGYNNRIHQVEGDLPLYMTMHQATFYDEEKQAYYYYTERTIPQGKCCKGDKKLGTACGKCEKCLSY